MNLQKIALLLIVFFINGCTSTTGDKVNGDIVTGDKAGRDNIKAGRDVTINSPLKEELQSIPDKGVIKSSVDNGNVSITPGSSREEANLFINASTSDYHKNISTLLVVNNIPISKYKEGIIKIKENHQISGSIVFTGGNAITKTYDLNSQYSDLTIKLDANPTQKGEYVKGNLSGKVFDGTEIREVLITFMLSVIDLRTLS